MTEKKTKPVEQQQVLTAINFLIVGLMLTCFAFIMGKFIQTLYPGWELTLFPALAFLVTLEALILRHIRYTSYDKLQNPIILTLVELILIILFLKFVTMFTSGFSLIWLEIKSWQHHFFSSFFDTDYLVLILAVLFIWMIACLFSQSLNRLGEDEKALAQEKLGYSFTDRQGERRFLISLVFFIGFAMIVQTVLMTSHLELLPNSTIPARSFIIILLLYFFTSFVLLALNQYIIMKAHWYLEDITVHPSLAKRWILFSLSFILLVILVIVFLPTNFTVGFYPIAQAIYQGFLFLFSIIQFLFTLPIAFVVSLINSLISTTPIEESTERSLREFVRSIPEIPNSIAWWEVVKSILFWLIFLGVIVFSIRYYLKNRESFSSFLSRIEIAKWLRDIWDWLSQCVMKIHKVTAETLQKGAQNIRTFFQNRKIKLPSLADIARRLPPRQAVILTYVDWVRWSQTIGINRQKSHTPIEFARVYQTNIPEAQQEINALTDVFIRARYTRQNIDREQAQVVRESLSSLKEIFRMRQREKASE